MPRLVGGEECEGGGKEGVKPHPKELSFWFVTDVEEIRIRAHKWSFFRSYQDAPKYDIWGRTKPTT